jgi:hypothetical protein
MMPQSENCHSWALSFLVPVAAVILLQRQARLKKVLRNLDQTGESIRGPAEIGAYQRDDKAMPCD